MRSLALALVVALSLGCGGRDRRGITPGSDGGGGRDGGPGFDSGGAGTDAGPGGAAVEFLDAYAGAICDYGTRCDRRITFDWIWQLSAVLCHPEGHREWVDQFRDAIARGRFTFDAAAAAACLAALGETADCIEVETEPVPCRDAFVGTVADGGECIHSMECMAGSRCELGTTCPGTCITTLGAACRYVSDCSEGESCRESMCQRRSDLGGSCRNNPDCLLPLTCIGDFGSATCRPRGGLGDECEGSSDCSGELLCVFDDVTFESSCVSPVRVGSPCSEHDECEARSACYDGTCEWMLQAGDACTEGDLTRSCPIWAECIGGVCAPEPTVGEACTSTCRRGACDGGTCRLLSDGETCGLRQCMGFCNDDTDPSMCAPGRGEGERCFDDLECADGLKCRGPEFEETCSPVCT